MEGNTHLPHLSGWNPLAPVGRSWRRLRRRPRAMQVRTALIVIAIVVGLVAWLAFAPSGTPGSAGAAGAAERPNGTGLQSGTPVSQASTSDRGVSKTEINVVFPVVAVNGRKINPMIVQFDPSNEANDQALCRQWTQGSPAVFAVVDGIGTWLGPDQLCVTQQGQTPLISAWSTTTNWTNLGSPYLWWTGADMAPVLAATVQWGISSGRLGHGKKVGIVVSDQAPDQAAMNDYLLPDLKKAGITPMIETVAAGLNETASTSSDAQLAVEKFKAAGVQSIFPLIYEPAFFPFIGAESSQQYYPQLLLSDYQSTVETALGLIPVPYEAALDGQEGVTTETLGGFDDARPESQGGYDPGVRSCYQTWHGYHPKPIPGTESFYIEEQGPIQAWCGAIRLFAEAAKTAGPDLNRRSFATAMSKITNFPGTLSPNWTFGAAKFYGPSSYQVVKVHNNVPPSSQCKLKTNHKPQGTCWVTVQGFKPLPAG